MRESELVGDNKNFIDRVNISSCLLFDMTILPMTRFNKKRVLYTPVCFVV